MCHMPCRRIKLADSLSCGSPGWFVLCLAAGIVFSLLMVSRAHACAYTVREVGFVDLDNPPYQLYGIYHGGEAGEEFRTAFLASCAATLLDANVKSELIDVGEMADHPAVEAAKAKGLGDGPAIVVRSPSDHWLVLPIEGEGKAVQQSVWNAVESVVTSPMREKVLDELIESYAVVLIVEGEDAQSNARVQETAKGAIATWQQLRSRLPKPVKVGPRVVTIKRGQIEKERVFLWALGMDVEGSREPWAAVMFARGKLIGEVMEGWLITQTDVYRNHAMVGQDCECSLDRAWLRGKMAPLVWDERRQAKVVEQVRFDTENPLVQAEMSRILSRGPNGQAPVGLPAAGAGGKDDLLLGYVETPVAGEAVSDEDIDALIAETATTQPVRKRVEGDQDAGISLASVLPPEPTPIASGVPTARGNAAEPQRGDGGPSTLASAGGNGAPLWWTLGGLVLVVLAGGVVIVIRARRAAV